MDLGTGITLAGLAIAVAMGLPSIFSYLEGKRATTTHDQNEKAIEELVKSISRIEAAQEAGMECLEELTTTVLIHRSIVREFESLDPDKQEKADTIFSEYRSRLRRKLLHLALLQKQSGHVLKSAFQLASQLGDVDTILKLEQAKKFIDAENDIGELQKYSNILQQRLNIRS